MLTTTLNKIYYIRLWCCLIACVVLCQVVNCAQIRLMRSNMLAKGYSSTSELIDEYADDDDDDDDVDEDPETKPRLFEGDIELDLYDQVTLRLGVSPKKYPHRLWPNGIIPYMISNVYTKNETDAINRAIQILEGATCIDFVIYNGTQKDYVFITPPLKDERNGCYSPVGRRGGEQRMTLQQKDENSKGCFTKPGHIMHELMHTMGFYHEQSRSDRNKFVKVNFQNIEDNYKDNFSKYSKSQTKHPYKYDYKSVMHYGAYFFAKDKEKQTITPLQEGVKIGQRKRISKRDCLRINDLYGCMKGKRKIMYESLCWKAGL